MIKSQTNKKDASFDYDIFYLSHLLFKEYGDVRNANICLSKIKIITEPPQAIRKIRDLGFKLKNLDGNKKIFLPCLDKKVPPYNKFIVYFSLKNY